MLRQRQQQQIEKRQRDTDQRVLHRVHRETFQYFEQKETGERQDDKQQRIIDRSLTLQVLISAGSIRFTPKLRLLNASQSPLTQRCIASWRLVEKNEVCQSAVKP